MNAGRGARGAIADGDADTARVADFERDRRELLRGGMAVGGAIVAASSIPLLLSARDVFAASRADVEFLERAIKLERVAVLAYGRMIGSGLLSPRLARVAKLFEAQEQEHTDSLVAVLTGLHVAAPLEPVGLDDVDAVVEGIRAVKSQSDVLNFAIELEMSAVAAYHDAQRELVDARLLQLAASIMANEGQHLVVLRQAAGKPPVPNALETGDSE